MIAPLFIRFFLGYVFISQGYKKLFSDFKGTKAMVSGLGFKPDTLWAGMLGLVELLGGILILIGWHTEIASGVLFLVMLIALYAKIRWKKSTEYVIAILDMLLTLFFFGPGTYSVSLLL